MFFKFRIILLCLPLLSINASAAGAGSSPSSPQQRQNDKHIENFQSKSRSIDSLMSAFRSAATETGNSDQIKVIEDQVEQQRIQAQSYLDKEEYPTGIVTLDQAYNTVKNAIIQLRDGSTVVKNRNPKDQYEIKHGVSKGESDYEHRAQSIQALISAFHRVSEEKGQKDEALVLESKIDIIVKKADKIYASGDQASGLYQLNSAYTLIKEALSALRDGDTLVSSLNFANKKEEYDYYFTKTSSQKTALLILQSLNPDNRKTSLDKVLITSQALLDEASKLAADNRFEEAVPIMDKVLTRLQSGLMMAFSMR